MRLIADPDAADGPLVVAVARVDASGRNTPAHRHARGQLLGATRGLISVVTDRGHWVVPAIHAIWIPPRCEHALRSHGAFAGWSAYVLESEPLPAEPRTFRVSELLRAAVDRAATWRATYGAAEAHIARVIVDEIAASSHEALGLPMPRDPRLATIANGIACDPADRRSIAAWAKVAGVTARTATRRFASETGFSFTAWRQRARLLRALELLAAGESVTSTALEVGYRNVSAFIAAFRNALGTTPASYATAAR